MSKLSAEAFEATARPLSRPPRPADYSNQGVTTLSAPVMRPPVALKIGKPAMQEAPRVVDAPLSPEAECAALRRQIADLMAEREDWRLRFEAEREAFSVLSAVKDELETTCREEISKLGVQLVEMQSTLAANVIPSAAPKKRGRKPKT